MLAAKRMGRHTSSACLLPKVRLKLLRNLGVHKALPNSSSPWQELYRSKKKKKKGKKEKEKERGGKETKIPLVELAKLQ